MFCFLTRLLKLRNPFDTDREMLIKPIYRVGRAAKLAKPTIRLIRDGEKGVWRRGKREIIRLSLHCHHQNDSCIKMGRNESHLNISLIARDKATRQRPETTTFEEKGELKMI